MEILGIMVLVSIVEVYFIIPTIVTTMVLYGARHIFVSASRNVKRVESITRSPIYAHTNATVQGLSTIRAFKAEESVKRNFDANMDLNSSVKLKKLMLKFNDSFLLSGLVHVLVFD
jgi:ATP-binding cassette, subfamily C (CFTR/MRP), member 4